MATARVGTSFATASATLTDSAGAIGVGTAAEFAAGGVDASASSFTGVGISGYTHSQASGMTVGSLFSSSSSSLYSVGTSGYVNSTSATSSIGNGSISFDQQSQFVAVSSAGASSGITQIHTLGGGSILDQSYIDRQTLSTSGFSDTSSTTNTILGTGEKTQSATIINSGGIELKGERETDCCGKNIASWGCDCKDGCCTCNFGLCGDSCDFSICGGIECCCKGIYNLGATLCSGLGSGLSAIGGCLSGAWNCVKDIDCSKAADCCEEVGKCLDSLASRA